MTGFEYQDAEETYNDLEKWLKKRRDQFSHSDYSHERTGYHAIDALLDEVREAGAEGFLPWQKAL